MLHRISVSGVAHSKFCESKNNYKKFGSIFDMVRRFIQQKNKCPHTNSHANDRWWNLLRNFIEMSRKKPFRWESDRSLGNVIVSARPSIRILAQNAMLLVWSILNLAIWPGTIVGTEKIQLKFSRKLILILFGNSCRSSHEHTMCGRQFPFSFSNAIDIRFNLLKLMQFVWQIAVCVGVCEDFCQM